MGHVGLQPQSVNALGGFRAQGRSEPRPTRVVADAHAIAEAGAFAIVVEGTVEPVARSITEKVPVPTIGIGASPACDGQILVTEDILGLFGEFTPRFVKRYAELAPGSPPPPKLCRRRPRPPFPRPRTLLRHKRG